MDEDIEEREQILAEAAMFKKLAIDYSHPEKKVENNDPTSFGRNYFNRADAPEITDVDEDEERAQILADAALLKKQAMTYSHPEAIIEVDSTAFGRNYFTATQDMDEDIEEREQILAEAAMFKKLAIDYSHPEKKVENNDPTSFGRNYFNRADAPEITDVDEDEERAQILADAALFKKEAIVYSHPEAPIEVDSTSFGRNYFTSTQDMDEDEEERAQILAEAAMLKTLASNYAHPEVKVQNTDPTVFGRNYFNRADAPDTSIVDEEEERAQILADAKLLKKEAIVYSHPEAPIDVDCASFGRNYFAAQDMDEDDEERAQILAEAAMFKKLATDYLHPEVKVQNTDPASYGRNYFNRANAAEVTDAEEDEERAQILADAALFKKEAINYSHPEASIVVDPTSFSRNYFSASQDMDIDEDERAQILEEAAMFKKLASNYAHPEAKVKNTDPTSFGRNYFTRPSAPEVTTSDDDVEHAQILADMALLKKEAMVYSHPEAPVEVGSTSFGRNYFTATQRLDEDDEERVQILAEVAMLRKLASDYAHPETKVTNTDSTAFARNIFHTPAASKADATMVHTYTERVEEESPEDISIEEDDHHELFEFDDYDQFTDMRQQLGSLNQPKKTLPHAASFADFSHNKIEIKDDDGEGHLSRSPSCVAFFDYF